jgi:hypothetical protein
VPQAPQAQLPMPPVNLTSPSNVPEPNIFSNTANPVVVPPNTPLGTWQFKLKKQGAGDFQSLTKDDISDVLLLVNFTAQ